MNRTSLSLLITALILIPAQAVFFNHLVLFNVAVPLAFIFVIITLPVTYSANRAMTIGFLLGWLMLFIIWYVLRLPLGPGSFMFYPA